jgi:hypothetical protein
VPACVGVLSLTFCRVVNRILQFVLNEWRERETELFDTLGRCTPFLGFRTVGLLSMLCSRTGSQPPRAFVPRLDPHAMSFGA